MFWPRHDAEDVRRVAAALLVDDRGAAGGGYVPLMPDFT